MANEYGTLAQLKASLSIPADDTTQDNLVQQAHTAASRAIDRTTGRRFYLDPAPVRREFRTLGRLVCEDDGDTLLLPDIGDAAGLIVESADSRTGPWTAVADYAVVPENALLDNEPVTGLLRDSGEWGTRWVRITARWGWPAVPDEVVSAALLQAARLFRRKDSPEGVMGSAEWGLIRLSRVDPDVQALIQHLILIGIA
ncbi:phage gp6-like head-tail connector protein [Amycolatopsis methanolica]|uniref:Phage gp6-like head-tail connector protein n=1 Tax=Amycolatopsis methanolica 239 TaxID=1068978 RepID=A0A076N0Q0_AMYME|nr:phage gp6-like head-tail connector protein [Amycolatopsis methanolica]AIJ26364.1 hypothetical protein AMETH_6272 [Amycolatopsis methanolica 239]AIJ26423.1 hypothetical protein AMETH_6331 [Amycolatopsis methanolica 239]